MMDRSMGDEELDQIEREVEGYELENFPISGVQLSAIIQRLRLSEKVAHVAIPFMQAHQSKRRLERASNAWAFPRFGAMMLAIGGGLTGAWLGSLAIKSRVGAAPNDILIVSFISLSFIIPMITIGLSLLGWIDRIASRRLEAGVYDAED